MAFTGTPALHRVSDGMVRLTGVSLAAGADGTISMDAGTGEVKFGAAQGIAPWEPYEGVSLQTAVKVETNPVTDVSNFGIPIRVVKTGTDPSDFLITLTNDSAATASAELEIYISFHT